MANEVPSLLLLSLACVACSHTSQRVIEEALAQQNPARSEGPVGAPPTSMQSLTIAPTGLAPTQVPSVAPRPISPKMDADYMERKMPDEAGASEPVRAPSK